MTLRRLLIPETLAQQLESLAAERGGLTQALQHLAELAGVVGGQRPLESASISKIKPRFTAGDHHNQFDSVAVKLSLKDLQRIDEQGLAMNLTRGQWIAALVRHRFGLQAQFNRWERMQLASIRSQTLSLQSHLAKIARVVHRSPSPAEPASSLMADIDKLAKRLDAVLDELGEVLKANKAYWAAKEFPLVLSQSNTEEPPGNDDR